MAIHEGTTVVGAPARIGQGLFARILRDHASPAAAEAEAAWVAVSRHGVDPLFALAVFHQESQFGRDGVCRDYATCSPGNTRTSRTGVGELVRVPGLGQYVRYPSWEEGWRDLAFRLVDPGYVYQREGRRTIRPVIERWAPRPENDPEVYIVRVVRNMNAWQDPPCLPVRPPPYDGADKRVDGVVFHADRRTVEVAVDGLRCRRWADPGSCETREPLRRGQTFEALYWVEGVAVAGERRWWVARSGSRIWCGGTLQKPADG